MLEIHLFSGGMAFERATACFREHWEGTLPVLGDDGARGWSNYAGTVHAQETTVPTAVDEEESVHHDTTGDTYVDWAASENRADLTTSHPYRATTDPADPERVVLFDDLAPFLVHLSDWSDLAALTRFATEHVFRVTLPWCVDDVVFNSASAKGDDYKDDGGDEDEGPMDAWAWDELAYRQDLSPWFPAPHLLSIIDLFRDPLNDTGDTETFQTPPPSSMLPIARRILDALLDTPLRRHILPYYTYIAEPKTSSRRLKALLRDDTGNVELWLLYAVVVEKLGKVEEARRVCSSVLDMREQLPAAEHSHLAAVCQYLVEMDVRAAALDKALGM